MKRTLTTTLMALLLCVCMVFALTSCGEFTQDDIDNAVNEATAPLNEQIAALEADIAAKVAKITTIEGEKAALTTEKGELEADIQEIEAEVATLETEKATIEAEVAALEEEKATLTSDKATLEASITAKNNEIANLNSSISALNTDKATLTARVSDLEASIAAKDKEIADLKSSIATLTENNEQLEAENATLKSCLAGKHVMDTDGKISYAWSKDYSTCTATGGCVYCDGEVTAVANGVAGDNKIIATFENSALVAQAVHTVTTYEELSALLESGKAVTIRLDATLENIESVNCDCGTKAVLDMNGKDIIFDAGSHLFVDSDSLTLKGVGTITTSGTTTIFCRGSLSIEEGVTVNGSYYAISFEGHDYRYATLNVSGGTINAKSNGKNYNFVNEYVSVTVTGGTFSCDPTEYVDTEKYAVTENGNWTVGCNHKDSTHTTFYDIGNGTHGFICTVCDSIVTENHSFITTDTGKGTHAICCTVCDSESTEKHTYADNDECACGAKIPVATTYEELLKAVENGGNIKLGDDIELTSRLLIESDVSIDLNGKILSRTGGGVVYIYSGYTVSIYNGTIVNDGTALENYGTLTVDSCTITAGMCSLKNSAGTTVITNSTLYGTVDAYGGTVIIHEDVVFEAGTSYFEFIGLSTYNDGSIVCYFDPSDMLFTAYGESKVTDNGDGTWTVTKAE